MGEIEDRRVDADAECEHDRRRRRKCRRLCKLSERESEILDDRSIEESRVFVAARLLHLVESAKVQASLPPGLTFVHAANDVIGCETFEVFAQFGVQLTLQLVTMSVV